MAKRRTAAEIRHDVLSMMRTSPQWSGIGELAIALLDDAVELREALNAGLSMGAWGGPGEEPEEIRLLLNDTAYLEDNDG